MTNRNQMNVEHDIPILRHREKRKEPDTVTDEQWQAIINNDASYNGKFFYAVRSTGIFCYPSCKSRPPKREHVGTYKSADQALTQFRPCKRCKPTGTRLPNEEWIATVTDYINQNYNKNLNLEHLAEICHGTPYHLQRTFKKVVGVTPSVYIQNLRINYAKQILIKTEKPISEVGESVGLVNPPYFITLFKKIIGTTPEDFRHWHKHNTKETVKMSNDNQFINWTLLTQGEWNLHIAVTDEGLCFVGSNNHPYEELVKWATVHYPNKSLVQDDEGLLLYSNEIAQYLQGTRKSFSFPIVVKGTPFQEAVWSALNQIPYGEIRSYSDIATLINKPSAVRAVGTAIADNPVLITIPCHRVIGKNGELSGYRGGRDMKTKLLELEQSGFNKEGSGMNV